MATYYKIKSTMRITDFAGVSDRIVKFLKEQNLAAYPEFETFLPELERLTAEMITALNQDGLESKLAEKDDIRDEKFRSLYSVLKACLLMPVPLTQQSARVLLDIIDKYGLSTVNDRYDAESAKIMSMTQELREHQGEMSSISNINVMVAQLEAAQKDFEDTKRKYDQAKELRKDTTKSASAIKPDLLKVINTQLVPYYSGMVQFRDEAFKNIADTINNWIEEANDNNTAKK